MSELTCDKHNISMECMAGESAHRSNWYCPTCYLLDTMTSDEMVEQIQSLQSQLDDANAELTWAAGQFQAIRLYTQDGKTAAACADGESRLEQALATPQEGEQALSETSIE